MENLLRVVTTMTNGGSHTLLIRTFSIFVNFLFRRRRSKRFVTARIKHANHSAPKDLGIGFQAELFDW